MPLPRFSATVMSPPDIPAKRCISIRWSNGEHAGQRGIAAVEKQSSQFFAGLASRAAETPFRCRRTVQALAAVHFPTPDDLPEPATHVVLTCASV